MLDPTQEKVYSACELTRLMKSEMGIERSHMALRRWMRNGLRRKGKKIRLESIDIGGQLCSSLEALQRFFRRLSEVCPICEAVGYCGTCSDCGYEEGAK